MRHRLGKKGGGRRARSKLKTPEAKQVGRVPEQSKLAGNIRTPASPPPRRRKKTAGLVGGDLPASVMMGSGGNWYSPELSTDFLELPQSLEERRAFYKFFYENEPFVGQAIDLHTELPLSKIRLRKPVAKDPKMALAATRFCERWADEIRLLHRMLEISHELALHGEGFVFVEDNNPDPSPDLLFETVQEVQEDGTLMPRLVERPDAQQRLGQWMRKNYRGWTDMYVIPAEQVRMEGFSFTKAKIMELVPDARTKSVIERAQQGEPQAQDVVATMPQDLVERIVRGENLPLNTDPMAGSFVSYIAKRRASYDQRGVSILQRCLLPGTPIWVERDGTLMQVPVEQVRDDDLALTHKGRLRPLRRGSRPVCEEVVRIRVEDSEELLGVTTDHEVLRLRPDGTEEWVAAGRLQPGDLLAEPPVCTGRPPRTRLDLEAHWRGRGSVPVERRRRGGTPEAGRSLCVGDVCRSGPGLRVELSHTQDDGNRVDSLPKMQRLASWLQALPAPTEATYEQVCAETGLAYKEVQNYAHELRKKAGLRTESRVLGRGKGRATTWHPLPSQAEVPGSVRRVVLESPVSSIPLDEGFLYLLGAWFGDGDAWQQDGKLLNVESIGWTFGDDPVGRAVRDRVRAEVVRLFGDAHMSEDPPYQDADGKLHLRVRDQLLARFFFDEFGHGASGKRIPSWVFDLSGALKLAFLRGILDTDGCLMVNRASIIEVTLDNKVLIDQIRAICLQMRIHSNLSWDHKKARSWTRRWKVVGGFREKTYHYEAKSFPRLYCSRHEDVRRWATGSVKAASVDWPARSHAWGSRFDAQGRLLRRVESVELQSHVGDVYSFGVEEDESHVTCGITTHNCLRTLVFRDKLRQAQTSIASRHMTPYRLVWAETLSIPQLEDLRLQVDQALQDPDYSIVTNFQVNWEEKGGGQENRLLELTSEYDITDRQLYAGLGVTESLLSGESSYSGDRINLEVLNVRFLLIREVLADFINFEVLKPMCARMGFVELDEDGSEVVIFPRASFTRLALRDNQEVFETLFNLYQKGSLDVETIYELLNIDPDTVQERLKRDLFTLNDATFNELLRGIYTALAEKILNGTQVAERVSSALGLRYSAPKEPPADEGGRF